MEVIDRIKDFFIKDDIGEPPWEYDFLYNLPESEYPKYLKKIFKYRTGEDLPLKREHGELVIDKKRCKTFNQKIQWLKLYDATPLKRDLTDKIKVRDYVRGIIGEEYLKPVLQICNSFDEIDFDKLPNAFVMKCNHGCKWQYIIKDKKDYLSTPKLVEITKRQMTGWLEQEFWPWEGFEMQYKGIQPKILIEPYIKDTINEVFSQINVYCFGGEPKIYVKFNNEKSMSVWDEYFQSLENIFISNEILKANADKIIRKIMILCSKLTKGINFVRLDWMINDNKIYFEEMTFTPYSGFKTFYKNGDLKLGNFIKMYK